MLDFVIGVVFLLNAQGDVLKDPNIFAFNTMSECQAAREELRQYAAENLVEGSIAMACIPAEAFI